MEQATPLRSAVEASGSAAEAAVRPQSDPPPAPAVESVSKLSIRGAGLTFDREIPDGLVLRVMNLVITGASDSESRQQTDDKRDLGSNGRKEALAEFYRRADPRKIPEKLTTIGSYFQQVMGRGSFTSDDLRGQFRSVNEPVPGNLPRDLKVALGEGWIAEEHDQTGQYFVTRSGLDAVEVGFSADGGRKGGRARRRKRSTKTAAPDSAGDSE